MFLGETFPVTERVASGISTREMFSQAFRPMFLLWAFCMLLTASTELGPQQWQESVLTKTAHLPGTLILVYTSCLMFILRHFAGSIAHKVSPIGMLTGSAFLSAIGLYALSYANNPVTAVAFATIYGLGIVFFWPTMLGVTAERFPRGGAFLLGLMGCAGNLAIAAILPVMGGIYDRESTAALSPELKEKVVVTSAASGGILDRLSASVTPEFLKSPGKIDEVKKKALSDAEKADVDKAEATGAQWSFRYVSALPVVVFFIFGAIALADKARGGYKPEVLKGDELTPQELTSDF
jgi:hypothetical protein